ncbi:MAG TPA: HAMP domain-containing sensor histidine kinase [Solirubrobacteraceae bacterium]|nr:HAMP domain-containing sensor histidine kinase [Solirubrobacteraceae bacterium]
MIRSLVVAAIGLVLSAAVMAVIGGAHAALLSTAVLAPVGVAVLAGAHLASARPRWVGPLSRRFALGVGVTVGALLLAIVLGSQLMFISEHDAWVTAGILVFATLVAGRAAQLLSSAVRRDVEAIRDGLLAVERGSRDVRLVTGGCDELTELADAGNHMITTLAGEEASRDAADIARRQVVASLSHDLRTPITSLALMTEAINDGMVDQEAVRRYLPAMQTHVQALAALVDDLFELSRLEAGQIVWTVESVSLAALVDDTVAALEPDAEAKGVALKAQVGDDLRPAQGSRDKLQRVLFNLLQNAIRHTPSDGAVTVRAAPVGEEIEVEVADTGNGIAVADRVRVFDAFYRGTDNGARAGSTSGLGLAIARAIIEAHGGRIWVEPADPGTRVRFRLPARSA